MAGRGRCRPPTTTPTSQGWAAPRRDVLPDGAVLAEWWRRLVGRILDSHRDRRDHAGASPFPCARAQVFSAMSDYLRAGRRRPAETGVAGARARPPSPGGLLPSVGADRPDRRRWSRSSTRRSSSTTRGATPGKMVVGTVVRRVGGPGPLTVVDGPEAPAHRPSPPPSRSLVPLLAPLRTRGCSLLDPAWLLWDPKRQCPARQGGRHRGRAAPPQALTPRGRRVGRSAVRGSTVPTHSPRPMHAAVRARARSRAG